VESQDVEEMGKCCGFTSESETVMMKRLSTSERVEEQRSKTHLPPPEIEKKNETKKGESTPLPDAPRS
jgi:hypothetical protein